MCDKKCIPSYSFVNCLPSIFVDSIQPLSITGNINFLKLGPFVNSTVKYKVF